MTEFVRTRTAWKYTDDQGNDYKFNALTGYTTQSAVLGGEAAGSVLAKLPRGHKPRHVYCHDAAAPAHRRKVVCYEPTATAYTTPGTAVNVDYGGLLVEFVSATCEGEEKRGT